MKKLKYIFLFLAVALTWTACKVEDPELGPEPTEGQVKFSASPDADNPNIIHFKNESGPVTRALWDFGNGTTDVGNEVKGAFALAGDYTVKLTVYTSGGSAFSTQTIKIAKTNPAMLDREDYNLLTGGGSALNGKTWVIDRETGGHMGVGPIEGKEPEWWKAGPNDKKDEGMYDDEMTFNLNNNFAYTYNNHGSSFVNGDNAPALGGVKGADYTMAYTPPANLTWSVTTEGEKNFLTISNGGFIAYYTGVSKYEILNLSENELYLKVADNANSARAWWLRLIPKGYSKPIIEKPLKEGDIKDSFDGTGKIAWLAESIVFKPNYDNPFPKPANTSAKTAYYERLEGEANQYANLQTTLDYRLNLSAKNKFKLKVFFPGSNDYSKVKPQVALKLQNSLDGGNAWQTQKEVIVPVTIHNQWVELVFDFSDIAGVTKYDKLIVQPGGEGHPNEAIFYIDELELF